MHVVFIYLILFLFIYIFGVLGLELRGLHLEPLCQPFFVLGFFKIGSRELSAQAGFEP
jgi:hypothetical protein